MTDCRTRAVDALNLRAYLAERLLWRSSQTYDRDGNVASESRSLGGSGDAVAGTQTFVRDVILEHLLEQRHQVFGEMLARV